LMEHLSGRGITCPTPVRAHDGSVSGRLCGRPAAIVTFLDGVSLKRPRAEHCRQLGRALAALHTAGADFPLTRANALSVGAWRPLFESAQPGAEALLPGLAAEIERELDRLEAVWPAALPAGIVHGDLFPDNAFFLGEALSGIIDFYFACN